MKSRKLTSECRAVKLMDPGIMTSLANDNDSSDRNTSEAKKDDESHCKCRHVGMGVRRRKGGRKSVTGMSGRAVTSTFKMIYLLSAMQVFAGGGWQAASNHSHSSKAARCFAQQMDLPQLRAPVIIRSHLRISPGLKSVTLWNSPPGC